MRRRNGCPSVAHEISARWFGNGRRIACFLRLWRPGVAAGGVGHTATVSFAFIKTHI